MPTRNDGEAPGENSCLAELTPSYPACVLISRTIDAGSGLTIHAIGRVVSTENK